MAKRQREKALAREKSKDKRPTAIARYIRIPSSKVDIVLDLIRGKDYNTAVAIMKNTNKSSCEPILKVLQSAAANAENNLNIMKDNLFVAECWAMAGPTLKRMMPRARGRADRILKRTSHIRIILDEKKEEPKKEIKKEVPVKKAVQSNQTKAKALPKTQAEKPLTDKPNNKAPLGTKKALATSGNKAAQSAKDAKTATPAKTTDKKGAKK